MRADPVIRFPDHRARREVLVRLPSGWTLVRRAAGGPVLCKAEDGGTVMITPTISEWHREGAPCRSAAY